jgi:pSer/pThr/pTyr-binding forkhead associated (FHA) protein
VFVNGTRVEGTQTLGRADVIRLGPEEFRFYADTLRDEAPTPAVAQPPVSAAPSPTPEPSAPPPAPPVSAPEAAAPAPVPPARAPAGAPVLATLEIINEGPNKGRKYELRGPLSNVGRGSHNDVVIVDSSVSDQHAKIIRRDGSWYLQDAGSTNGSYVGGKRIEGEVRLEGSPDVRFGSIKLSFRPAAPASTEEKGTKVIAGIKTAEPKRETSETAPGRAAAAPSKGGGGVPVMVWVVLGVVILAAVAFFVMGR